MHALLVYNADNEIAILLYQILEHMLPIFCISSWRKYSITKDLWIRTYSGPRALYIPFYESIEFRSFSDLTHTTTLFSLSDHDILSWEWRVIVDKV